MSTAAAFDFEIPIVSAFRSQSCRRQSYFFGCRRSDIVLLSGVTVLTVLTVLVAVLAALVALPAVIIVVDFGTMRQDFAVYVQSIMMLYAVDFEFYLVEYFATAPFTIDVQVVNLFQAEVGVLQCRVPGSVTVYFSCLCDIDDSRSRQHSYSDTCGKYYCYQYYN